MKRILGIITLAIVLGIGIAAYTYWPAIRAAFLPPPADITTLIPPGSQNPSPADADPNTTGMPLTLPPDFRIEIFAKDLPGARVMRFDQLGNMWVSRTNQGAVSLLEIENGEVQRHNDVFRGLQGPHGLAFDPSEPLRLYIAEEHRVFSVATYSEDSGKGIVDLPAPGGHSTRTVGFGPSGLLYVSVGSSCNVCIEGDVRRAAILEVDPETKSSEIFARGLRNAVFFTWDRAGQMWATDMGRDWLGDNTPPDEVNIIRKSVNYGWPTCYGKNIHDTDFDKNMYIRNPCMEPFETPSQIDVPAHSAPLGLGFIPDSWPEEYRNDLLVSYHGSWNRSEPTGYKVVRHKFDSAGNYEGAEDFITGWLTPSGALGRPVDIVFHDGALYLSDDKAGVVYRVTRQ